MTKPTLDDFDAVKAVVTALEGFDPKTQERILRWTCEKLGLDTLTTGTPRPPAQPGIAPNPPPATVLATHTADIKSFVTSKNPTSDTQFAATVAYFYRFEAPPAERKESITGEDLQDACRKVGRARFPRVAQTLINAHTQGLLDRGDRGAYSINTVGENLVAMALPRDGSTTSATGSSTRKAKPKRSLKRRKGARKA